MKDWRRYQDIARRFQFKAKPQDREDIQHEIILRLAEVEQSYEAKGKPLTNFGMLRVAKYVVLEYWREEMRKPKLISLSEPVIGNDGSETELYQIIADDKAIDLDDWMDDKVWLLSCPERLLKVAVKTVAGIVLTQTERAYLYRQRKKLQPQLALA